MLERMVDRIQVALIAAMFLGGLGAWAVLPPDARVPVHFNLSGDADGWASASLALFALPVIASLLMIVGRVRMRLSADLTPSRHAIEGIAIFDTVIFAVLQAYVVSLTLGWIEPSMRIEPLVVGAWLIGIGNYMGKVRANGSYGFRWQWSMVSSDVWDRTHRFAGKALVLAGLAVLVLALAPIPVKLQGMAIVGPSIIAVLAIALKSYLLARHNLKDDRKWAYLRAALVLPFVLLFVYGMVNFYDAPYKPCGVDIYCGKGGAHHSEDEVRAHARWELALLISFPFAFVGGGVISKLYRK